MLQSYGLWLDDSEFNVCQIDVLYGKSLIIDFLDDFLKKRTVIEFMLGHFNQSYGYVLHIYEDNFGAKINRDD